MTQNRKENRSRPGWRGPGQSKPTKTPQPPKTSRASESKTATAGDDPVIPAALQQQLLNVFKNAFPDVAERGSDALKPLLQEVKQALFERDFERAFGREDYLEAYAFRWSPSRALCYVSILADLQKHLSDSLLARSLSPLTVQGESDADVGTAAGDTPVHIACLGGGAAEIVALGGYIKYLLENEATYMQDAATSSQEKSDLPITDPLSQISISDSSPQPPQTAEINLLLLDTASWGPVIQKLHQSLTSSPPLSKYASLAARTCNAALLPPKLLTPTFHQTNLLDATPPQLRALLGRAPTIVTLLFTLNELYSASIPRTTAFLLHLGAATAPGSLLLVVDSPGSYAEAVLGTEERRYPMCWLMDRTLLSERRVGAAEDDEEGKEELQWEKVLGDESRWFRLPEGLRYGISLENMRYQVHLFKRL